MEIEQGKQRSDVGGRTSDIRPRTSGPRLTVLSGHVIDNLAAVAAGSVQCVVTSPPYWGLRSYLPKGHPLKHLEIGQEILTGANGENGESKDSVTSVYSCSTVPCLVLDPFGGSGTTGEVALELGRRAILIELNPEYLPLIERRTNVTPGLAI